MFKPFLSEPSPEPPPLRFIPAEGSSFSGVSTGVSEGVTGVLVVELVDEFKDGILSFVYVSPRKLGVTSNVLSST